MEKIFANGMIFKAPRENAPDFVKGSISIKVDDFIAFLQAHNTNSGWVNIDLKESQSGKFYAELNQYKPEKPKGLETATSERDEEIDDTDNIPF